MFHEQIGILVEGTVIGIRIQDELRVRQFLLQNVRAHRWNDHVVAALHD